MENKNENKQIDLFDVLIVLAKHKKFILYTLLIVSIISVTYALLVDEIWTSKAVIRPVESEDRGLNLSGTSLLGLGSAILGGGISNNSQNFITTLKSRNITDKVIDEFDLINFFEIKEKDERIAREEAREILREQVRQIEIDDESGLIIIKINTTDKFLSEKIANYYWQELERYNQEFYITTEKRKRIFIENRLSEVEQEIEKLSLRLKDFMQDNKVIELEKQTEALVELYSELISRKIENEIELGMAKQIYTEDSTILQKLEIYDSEIGQQLLDIEYKENDSGFSYTLTLEKLPNLALEMANIKLNLEVQKGVYEYLYPQYEQAKIQEVKDFPTLTIIDDAEVAGRRSYPQRARLCITNFIVALILSIFVALFIDYIQSKKDKAELFKKTLMK